MENKFKNISKVIYSYLKKDELLTLSFTGEESQFIRLNNAKIRQTRIFLIAEHFNSSFDSNNFFSSPRVPYRDRNIRFGFNWNLFN